MVPIGGMMALGRYGSPRRAPYQQYGLDRTFGDCSRLGAIRKLETQCLCSFDETGIAGPGDVEDSRSRCGSEYHR